MPRIPVILFAQVPPPEHGQSRMVRLGLEALCTRSEEFEVHHVNARFSDSLENIGDRSIGKILLTFKYLAQAAMIRMRVRDPILYYVPGPVKWSAVVRDWVLLSVLRLFYSRVVFHWHAIGQGEWAHGSERLWLCHTLWIDQLARRISSIVLEQPYASISVVNTSCKDAVAVSSQQSLVLFNGIADPWPEFDASLTQPRIQRMEQFKSAERPRFKVLFLSHGTVEKGLIDALECLAATLATCPAGWSFQMTFAGGISDTCKLQFDSLAESIRKKWPQRVEIIQMGYLTGDDKKRCFLENDLFLAPSRWESFGLTVIEAMAYGMPIVAAASDGVKGVLPQGYPYLVPTANPSALSSQFVDCCATLITSAAVHLGSELRDHFLKLYQVKDFSENFTNAFLKLGADVSECAPVDDGAKSVITPDSLKITISTYLADQNPMLGRSLGISRMTAVMLEALSQHENVTLCGIVSESSIQLPEQSESRMLPWSTRGVVGRVLTDHLHPLIGSGSAEVHYFPKGFLPWLHWLCQPSVVTIHDTIIQHYSDYYPKWRTMIEYRYWAAMLKHTLRHATCILTVSESARNQIVTFMARHGIPPKEIHVTYEPCLYESSPQPKSPAKDNYVLHLGSREPHKRTAWLIREWVKESLLKQDLPALHVVGTIPVEVELLAKNSPNIMRLSFLDDEALQIKFRAARALILPSEIEGFGLPAIEAYYLGTPVCYTCGTSIEEVLKVATPLGGFSLDEPTSLFAALSDVLQVSTDEIYDCGLKLRKTYAAEIVADRMVDAFRSVTAR